MYVRAGRQSPFDRRYRLGHRSEEPRWEGDRRGILVARLSTRAVVGDEGAVEELLFHDWICDPGGLRPLSSSILYAASICVVIPTEFTS